jgi:hypothetical protein
MNHSSDKSQTPKQRNDSMNHYLMNLKLLNTEMIAWIIIWWTSNS